MPTIKALAATSIGGRLEPFTYEVGTIAAEEVEIEIEYTGICHSDLSMLDNEWGITSYPFCPGLRGYRPHLGDGGSGADQRAQG